MAGPVLSAFGYSPATRQGSDVSLILRTTERHYKYGISADAFGTSKDQDCHDIIVGPAPSSSRKRRLRTKHGTTGRRPDAGADYPRSTA